MAHVVFLPDEQTVMMLDVPQSGIEVVYAVQEGTWPIPEPYTIPPGGLRAFGQERLVVILPAALAGSTPPAHTRLSQRQAEVLQGLAEGLTTRQIASRLRIHPRTVELHVAAVKERLGTSSRPQTVGRAASLGLCRFNRVASERKRTSPK